MSEYQMKNNKLISLLLVLLGNVIYALSVKLFLLPANLISCGTTGIALVVNHFAGIPMPVFIFAFNILVICSNLPCNLNKVINFRLAIIY